MSNTPKYYRVCDNQTGRYFCTGYNCRSIKELEEEFRSYFSPDWDEDEEVDLNSLDWNDLSIMLSDVTLEISDVPFEDHPEL